MKKFLLVGFVILFAVIGLLSDDETEENTQNSTPVNFADSYNANNTWLIYWYICGSNLESDYGSATADIKEMIESTVPSNVKVLIQAGGSNKWHNDFMKAGYTNRCLYDETGLHVLETINDSDMGSQETLTNFLQYGKNNFDADHKVFIFWDHGGGSAFGVCHDERSNNILSLNNIRDAFVSVFTPSEENPPFELIGFDACLMATFDTANTIHGLAKYMVASEEVEPGNGWEYTNFLNKLGENPAMGGNKLGQIICDTYYEGCKDNWTEDEATLSVIDVTKIPVLKAAYDSHSVEALKSSAQSPKKFFSSLGRSAKKAENYGGNTRESAYYDMVDIGDFAKKTSELLPMTSQNLIGAVDDVVVYKIQGKYRRKGSGISGFYPYDGEDQIYSLYSQQKAATLPQKCLYYHLIYGVMPPEGNDILNGKYEVEIPKATQKQKVFDIEQLEDLEIKIDKNNNAYVTLTNEQMDNISAVYCNLAYVDTKKDAILYLGSSGNIETDWKKGKFTDNFDAKWLMLEGHPVFIEIVEENDDYDLYSIPIKLNGLKCNLQVAYDYKEKKYKILGAKPVSKRGQADKYLIKLKQGDKITTLHYGLTISGDDSEFTEVEVETFSIDANPKFEEENLSDGEYLYCFEFVTPNNESASSQFINFTVKNKKIYTSKID